jgi:rhodanese-related sulfurtransferase
MRSNRLATSIATMLLVFTACGGGASETESRSEVAAATGGAPSSGDEAVLTPDITGAEARELVANGAFLLDVTPSPRNEQSAIEGRTNIPLPELERRMSEVPRDRTVIVYCFGGRGSPNAAQMLRDAGYTDVRLLGAMENWNAGAEVAADAPSE